MYPVPPITGVLARTDAPMVSLAVVAVGLAALGALVLRLAILRRTDRRR